MSGLTPAPGLWQIRSQLGVCEETLIAEWGNFGYAIAAGIPISILVIVLTVSGTLLGGRFHIAYCFATGWMLAASFLVGVHCNTWVAWFSVAAIVVTAAYTILWWGNPPFLRPGGRLSFLKYSRLGTASKIGSHDTILFGSLNEILDLTWAQIFLVALYLVWVFGAVAERYNYYTTGIYEAYDKTQAFGRAISHAALRLWWFAELSGHRYGLFWGLFGIPYERLVSLHKMSGRLAFYTMCVHMGIMFAKMDYHGYRLSDAFDFNRVNMWAGLVAFIFTALMIATSIPVIRRFHFETFYWLHINFKFIMIVMILLHHRFWTLSFTITTLVSFWIDMAIRFKYKGLTKATLHSAQTVCRCPDGGEIVRLELSRDIWPGNAGSHEPGSYIMLSLGPRDKKVQASPIDAKKNMPIGGPPLPGSLYFHPMTISSPPSKNGPIVLMIKNMGPGTWSEEVCEIASKGMDVAQIRPRIGGPHGRLSIEPSDYDTVVLCAGGIGVTPMCSIWSEIALAPHKFPKVRRVVVLWVARSPEVFAAFQEFIEMARNQKSGIAFHFVGFLTKSQRAANGMAPSLTGPVIATSVDPYGRVIEMTQPVAASNEPSVESSATKTLHALGMELRNGRPNWTEELTKATEGLPTGERAGVFACGPASLMADVSEAQGKLTANTHLHKETFEW